MLDPRLELALQELGASPTRVVLLIDGGAGSGKSTLAAALAENWPTEQVQLVSMDDLYPGWDGLAAASAALADVIPGVGFHQWDWAQQQLGAWRPLDPQTDLIVEGCGSLTPASRRLADLAIWLEAPASVRRDRALARDGELFAAQWHRWAEQEAAHWLANRPQELADLVLPT